MERILIGVAGRLGSGKDSFAGFLMEHIKQNAVLENGKVVARVAFADALKEEAAEFLAGKTWEQVEDSIYGLDLPSEVSEPMMNMMAPAYHAGEADEVESFTRGELLRCFHDAKTKQPFRKLLQVWGTEYRRMMFADDYWLAAWQKRVDALPESVQVVICTDVRFPNEFEYLLEKEACMLRVDLPLDDIELVKDQHSSEVSLATEDRWQEVILNTGTLQDLNNRAEEFYWDFLDWQIVLDMDNEEAA